MGKKRPQLTMPPGMPILLHACCAPCSSAIVEWMLSKDLQPTIFYFNPNIYPFDEYVVRRDESRRHAESLGLSWVEGDYDHEAWKRIISGHENEPERGSRCLECFKYRLLRSAEYAALHGMACLTTTLASSRWKSQEQIDVAGAAAEEHTGVAFWHQNWRKDGLSERRAQLLREFNFYNQNYCGCEYSMR